MARLTKKDVLHVARLARLHLTEAEVGKFLKQLSKVVDYIGELNEVETGAVIPTSQTTGSENVLREDRVINEQTLSLDDALSGTEEVFNGYFKVDAVLAEKKIE